MRIVFTMPTTPVDVAFGMCLLTCMWGAPAVEDAAWKRGVAMTALRVNL